MKVMFLYKYCILGGVTTQLANRLNFLKTFCEPHFAFVSNHGGTVAFSGYPHVVIVETVEEIASYMQTEQFDLVVTIDTYELYDAIKQIGYKGKVIHEVHTTYVEALENLEEIGNNLEMDAIVTPSSYLMDIVQPFFNSHKKVHYQVVENCLDTTLFSSVDESLEGSKVLLWIGKLDAHKNWSMFIDFAKGLLDKSGETYELWMVGGHTAPEQVKEALLQKIKDNNLQANFKWFPNVSYTEMPEIYAQAANRRGIYVSTSQNESFGMTIAEALACNCPVVAPKVGAIPEVMSGDVLNQSLYAPNNIEDLIEKAYRLLNDSDFHNVNVEVGRTKIRHDYDITVTGNKYKQLLETVMTTIEN